MTGPQWAEAFDKGDPENIARGLYEAWRQAVMAEFPSETVIGTWDETTMDDATRRVWIQFGANLRDSGALRVTGESP